MIACRNNNLLAVKYLLKKGANINIQNNEGDTPLINACYKNNISIVKHLLKNKASTKIKNNEGETPLIIACMNRNEDLIRCIINQGDDTFTFINEKEQVDNGISPLFDDNFSFSNSKDKIIKYLINLICKMKSQKSLNIINYLIKKGYDICYRDENGITPLLMACYFNNDILVSHLIKNKIDFNVKNKYGDTPLLISCYFNNKFIINNLIEQPNVNLKNDSEKKLMIANNFRNKDIKKIFNTSKYGMLYIYIYSNFYFIFIFIFIFI